MKEKLEHIVKYVLSNRVCLKSGNNTQSKPWKANLENVLKYSKVILANLHQQKNWHNVNNLNMM